MPPVPPSLFTIIAERLFQASPNGVLVYQSVSPDELRLVLVNARAEQFFGPSPDLTSQVAADVLRHVFRTGEIYHNELELRPVDHSELTGYDVSAVRMDECVAVFYTDSTARRQAQKAEREQAERTKFILDNVLTAIATLDAVRDSSGQVIDFVYTMVNQMVEQLSGLSAAQLVGQRLLTLFPGTQASGLFAKWIRLMETGEPAHFLNIFSRKTSTPGTRRGRYVWATD